MRPLIFLGWLCCAVLCLTAAPLRAQPTAHGAPDAQIIQAAQAAYREGQAAELAGQIPQAIEAYTQSVALDPGGRFARRALVRLGALTALPAEDLPIAVRFRALQLHPEAHSPQAAQALVEAGLERARSPQLRAQLRRWQVEQALATEDRAAAFEHALTFAREPELPSLQRQVAFERALEAAQGDQLARLSEEIEAAKGRWPEVDLTQVAHEVWDLRLRRWVQPVLGLGVGIFLLFALRARAWRALRGAVLRRWRPWRGGLYLLWAFGGAAFLAERYEPRMGLPMFACGVVSLLVYGVAGAIGQCAPPQRRLTRMLLGFAVVSTIYAGCYIVLLRTKNLEWIGL